jgi:hypothetical protein
MLPVDIQKRLALKLKLNKIDNCGIVAPILLNELLAKLGHETKLVQGYCSVAGETCWHVWPEIGVQKFDIGYTIACLNDKEFAKCTMILHTNLAPGSSEPKTDTEVLDMWDVYKKDPREFWKKQSSQIQSFRAKVFRDGW